MRRVAAFSAFCLLAASASAQGPIALPKASPAASETLVVGTTTIAVDYHRPAVKGRKIWGELVPYGQVWRVGANQATTIRFSDAVKIEGTEVAAGTYALFAVPGKDSWVVILNSEPKQWGAYAYDAEKDVLQVEVKPAPAPMTEWMRLTLDLAAPNAATIAMTWEKLRVEFRVEVDAVGIGRTRVLDAVAKAPATDWVTFHQAARFYLDNDLDANLAMEWIEKSIQAKPTFFNLEVKARLLHKAGSKKDALALMEKAVASAGNQVPRELLAPAEKLLAQWKAGA